MVDNLVENIHECPIIGVVYMQLGVWKVPVVLISRVSTIQVLYWSEQKDNWADQKCLLYSS